MADYVPRARRTSRKTKIVTKTFVPVGVDFRAEDTDGYHSPDSVNFYRSQSGEWETHPGFRKIGEFEGKCFGAVQFQYSDGNNILFKVILHIGTKLYTWNNYPLFFTMDNLTEIYDGVPESIIKFAVFNDKLIALGGGKLIIYDGTTAGDIADSAFIPQTWQSKSPTASAGSVYQQRNLLTGKFKEGFVGDATADYQLSLKNLDAAPVTATVDGVDKVEGTHFNVDRVEGKVTWTGGNLPPAPSPARENVFITASKTEAGYADMVLNCSEMLVFDNRLFVTGSPKHPNRIFWTGYLEASYFGEVMYNDRAGSGSVPITALQLLSSNAILAIKQSTVQDGSYSVITPEVLDDENNPKTYTARQGSGTTGCVSKDSAVVFLDDNVYHSPNGLKAISREMNISQERNIEHRSTLVDSKMLLENHENCVVEQYEERLYLLFTDTGHVYIADGNLTIEPGKVSAYREYEWAYLKDVGIYKGQYEAYIDENGDIANPPDESGNETPPAPESIPSGEFIGGVFYPALNIQSLGDKELYLCCDGALCKFNFDLGQLEKNNELVPAAYSFNNRRIVDKCCFPYDWMGASNRMKNLIQGKNDLVLSTRTAAVARVTWRTDKTTLEKSKPIRLMSSGVDYGLMDYGAMSYGALPKASYVLKKLKTKPFRRLQVCIETARIDCCTAIQSLTLEAEIQDNDLK